MLKTADVLIFHPRQKNNRLTMQDKLDTTRWESQAFCLGYDRVIVHEATSGQSPENFVLVYRLGHTWARWGANRQTQKVILWRCSDGAQMGLFMTMIAALNSIGPVSSAFLSTPVH